MYPSGVTAQDGELPRTTGGWFALAAYATALVTITGVVTWRRTHPVHVADRVTAQQAAARWTLHHDSGDHYTLTNQRDDDARNVGLATTPRHRPWLATALGIRTPTPATPVRIAGHHTAATVPGGHSIPINLHNHRPHGWLEIDWTQPDAAPAWAKYPTTRTD